jgi:hypothetical protein
MADGEIDMLGIETFFCDDNTSIRANSGGYSEILVDLNSDVSEGDAIAVQLDAFGDERESYVSPVTGKVLSVATDPIREPGALLVRICADTSSMKSLPETDAPAAPTPDNDPPSPSPTDQGNSGASIAESSLIFACLASLATFICSTSCLSF